MKFAKELEREAVPEWRIKYLNYKAGKKYIKAVARAFNRASTTPRSLTGPSSSYSSALPRLHGPSASGGLPPAAQRDSPPRRDGGSPPRQSAPIDVARPREDASLKGGDVNDMQYGSFVPTPGEESPISQRGSQDLVLPGPAMSSPAEGSSQSHAPRTLKGSMASKGAKRSASMADVHTKAGHQPQASARSSGLHRRTGLTESPSQLKRLFSHSPGLMKDMPRNSFGLQPFDLVREREREFNEFLDNELEKVDGFYKFKEHQAGERLRILRQQLHEMRNRRMNEMYESSHEHDRAESRQSENGHGQYSQGGWISPIKAKFFPPGPNTRAFRTMAQTPRLGGQEARGAGGDERRDYSRRPEGSDVSYRTAKRKLKLALQEFYRGLELLKSYAILNRTAFRKLNKKFDKAVNARPPYRYMTEKVNRSWFVTSDVLESLIKDAEDLYARYFERGNYKLAAGKLRSLSKISKDDSGSSFLNGFYIGTGVVFTVQGLVYGTQLLFDDDAELRIHTSYLLQLYGGYFLMLTLFSLFCINCFIWTIHKVNYPFIFEFDMRHHVDWRRLAEFPSFCFLMFGLFLWINFSRYGPASLYLYYPVILIGLTVAIIFLPAPVLAYRSRQWFVYSHWRLLLAGIYPVEFRDFFLGDIYCSLTYATANIELFFCLYGTGWVDPTKCNSNHSRALGFLSALPPIWRFLQCIRRYRDTRNVFPHLVNSGKYSMTIMAAVTLSIYRIQNSHTNLAIFILFSTINGVYCSIWDLFMDFSLLQSQSRNRYLRDILALKTRWPYYSIMVIDPILRFGWIFYAIFTHDAQHSTVVSFIVALLEVIRRGIWSLFRVENEHCANVSQYKASRDVPLPYRIEPLIGRASSESSPTLLPSADPSSTRITNDTTIAATDVDPESQRNTGYSTGVPTSTSALSRLRNRSQNALGKSFSKMLAEAHKQDFEKRRKPADQEVDEEEARHGGPSDDEMDGEDDDVRSPSRGSDEEDEDARDYADLREVDDLVNRGTTR